jgi:hypothetical protein
MSFFDHFGNPPKVEPQPGNARCVVLVGLSEAVLPEEDWFHEALAELNSATSIRGYWADGRSASFTVAELTQEGPAEIGFGSIRLAATPIPADALAVACDRSWRWRQAAAVLAAHTHHWMVSVTTDTAPFHNAMVMGRLLAALSCRPAFLGAYFGRAELVHSPNSLRAGCDVEPDASPVDLWVHVTLDAHEDDTTSLRTQGLSQFGVAEIEIAHSRMRYDELYEQGREFAGNLMKAGPVLKDGDTVRTTSDAPHLVRYVPSIYNSEETVCRILL